MQCEFKSTQFPTSDALIPTFFVFNRFPKDVALAIMEHCSPFDLAQLRLISKFIRSFIEVNGHLWRAAQSNFCRGKCPWLPSPPAVEASGNYSQSAYALWIFGGGPCTCCGKWTNLLPFHFLFRFRCCSAEVCKKFLLSDTSLRVDSTKKYDNFLWGRWLLRIQLGTHNGGTVFAYSTRATQYAERERHQAIGVDKGNSWRDPLGIPCRTLQQLDAASECDLRRQARDALTKNASELDTWQKTYLVERASVVQANLKFFKLMSNVEELKLQAVLRCPTADRLFQTFNRDLSLITHTVWVQHRRLILAELKYMHLGVFPVGLNGRSTDKLRCAYCPRMIKGPGMKDHVVDKHKGQDPDAIPGMAECTEKHCPDCPDSKRMFGVHGLKDHQLHKHGNPNYPLAK
ncbi:hypothetical protein B0H17DRAFT_1210215 [Mycena rosella]|uniref:F-box domain-containing protein n=1 Tax=Mycena rosella TaxID=1033263 RepID=A0AAD7G926_MYCRO|nr:hypothetical protein B0H17DRAFT_1210215 [Mycena rosella]